MNPGTLDRKIQIQRQADGLFMVTATGDYMLTADGERMTTGSRTDALGQQVDAWGLWKTRMAKRVEDRPGKETEGSARTRSEGAVMFRIRHTRGLQDTDRLVDTTDGQAYDIQDFIGDPRQGWMEIHCTRRRTPANQNQTYS